MKTLPRDQAESLFNQYWEEMKVEWMKLEVLQDYRGEDNGPSLDSWLNGDKKRSIELMHHDDYSEWIADCQDKLNQGVKLLRLHVIEHPLTPYVEWEIEHYKHINIPKCGETVYLVDKAEIGERNLPAGDLMIFDSRRAIVNKYDTARGLLTATTFYDEQDYISEFLRLWKSLLELAEEL